MYKNKIISFLIILFSVFLLNGSSAFAQTTPFTVSTSVNKTDAIATVTYNMNVTPVPTLVSILVSDVAKTDGVTPVTYSRSFDYVPTQSNNKLLIPLDQLKPGATYYIEVYGYVSGAIKYETVATFKTETAPLPTPQPPLPFLVSYTATKDTLTFTITNNGSTSYMVMGDLYISGTTTNPVKSDINIGRINVKQVKTQTITGLKTGTRYNLKLTGATVISGAQNTTSYFEYKDAMTGGTGTGSGTTPTGTASGTTPTGTGSGTTPSAGGSGNTPKDNSITEGLGLDNPTNITSVEDFVAKALNIVVDIGTPLVAFFLILSGFMFVAAQGNEEKLQTAKRSLVYTLIGAALILGCWGIAQAIKGTVENVTAKADAPIHYKR